MIEEYVCRARSEMERDWARARRAYRRGDLEQLARVVDDAGGLIEVLPLKCEGGHLVMPSPYLFGGTSHPSLVVVDQRFSLWLEHCEAPEDMEQVLVKVLVKDEDYW